MTCKQCEGTTKEKAFHSLTGEMITINCTCSCHDNGNICDESNCGNGFV